MIYIAAMQRLGSGYEFTCDCKGWAVGMNSHVTAKATGYMYTISVHINSDSGVGT